MNWLISNLDWFAGTVELFASYIIGSKNRWGFLLNIICCLTWAVVAVTRDIPGLLLVVVPAIVINIRNWRKWK